MRKIWTIAWKDTKVRFKDVNAILLMLATPLLLSAIIGAAFGDLVSSGASPVSDIPFIIVDHDAGRLSQTFVEILTTEESLVELLEPTLMSDLDEARLAVQRGDTRAVVYIPEGFTEALEFIDTDPVTIQLYTDPAASITPFIIESVITQIVNGFSSVGVSTEVAAGQIFQRAEALGPQMEELGTVLEEEIEANVADESASVTEGLETASLNVTAAGENTAPINVNPLAFFAPSMGILFLMFNLMTSARSFLDERAEGTMSRLISSPVSNVEILLGKIGGTFLIGSLQFVVYVLASRLIFNLSWGSSPLGLAIMVFAVVAAFTSLGSLVAAFTNDIRQASTIGGAIVLIFAALGGNFVPAQNYPTWLQALSRLSINRWALDGFSDLTIQGLGVPSIALEAGVLLAIAAAFFILSLWQFQRLIAR